MMNKKINILIIAIVLSALCPAGFSHGQYIPNAPFKVTEFLAPDFSLKDLQGKPFQLRNNRGKPVLIFFGTTWCPTCRNEIPLYKKINDNYAKLGLIAVYVNIMEPKEKVARFVKANSLPFIILLDEDGSIASTYGIVGVPTLILIDKEGKIVKISHTTADLPLKKLFPDKK
jgi:peroxiredoxin